MSESSQTSGGEPFDIEEFCRQTIQSIEYGDAMGSVLEEHVIRLEEIVAARWPRSWLLRRPVGRPCRVPLARFPAATPGRAGAKPVARPSVSGPGGGGSEPLPGHAEPASASAGGGGPELSAEALADGLDGSERKLLLAHLARAHPELVEAGYAWLADWHAANAERQRANRRRREHDKRRRQRAEEVDRG